jgi:hypothetical protein
MDHAQIAIQYRKSAQACLSRAKRGENSVDWTALARKWEALARMYDDMSPISNYAPSSQGGRQPALFGRSGSGDGVSLRDKAGAIPNLKAIQRISTLREQHMGPRDRAFVREPEWQHLDAGNVSIA